MQLSCLTMKHLTINLYFKHKHLAVNVDTEYIYNRTLSGLVIYVKVIPRICLIYIYIYMPAPSGRSLYFRAISPIQARVMSCVALTTQRYQVLP